MAEIGDAAIINFSTGTLGVSVEKRVAYLEAGLPEVAALNMGSLNYAKYSERRKDFVFQFVFTNPFDEIIALLGAMRELGIKPEHECFDVGHVASIAPLIDMGLLEAPVHADFVMGVLGGIPATALNLAAMAANMPAGRHHWGVIGIGRVAMDDDRRRADPGRLGAGRSRGQLLPARWNRRPLQRGPDRAGAQDGAGRRPSAGDRRGGACAAGSGGAARRRGGVMATDAPTAGMLKMGELAERSGVSAGTIKHYLREGVLGSDEDVVRTSRNMAWYPEEFVDRILLVKRLQEDRFMPLRVIRELMTDDPAHAARLIELEDRILARAVEKGDRGRMSRREVRERYEMPAVVLERLEEIGVLTPSSRGYDPDDVAIIEAIFRFRAGGYEEALGFTVYDTLRYREALAPLVTDEVNVLVTRVAAQVDIDRALQIIESGVEPLRDLIGAMHSKMLVSELHRQRRTRAS